MIEQERIVDSKTSMSIPQIGKVELLNWAKTFCDFGSQIDPFEFHDLADGEIYTRILAKIWPKLAQKKLRNKDDMKIKTYLKTDYNWKIIEGILNDAKIPTQIYDLKAIQAGKFRQTFQFLVMLYFFNDLVEKHECNFSLLHPIEPKLKQFMSSKAPLDCLVRAGSVRLENDKAINFSLGVNEIQLKHNKKGESNNASSKIDDSFGKISSNDSLRFDCKDKTLPKSEHIACSNDLALNHLKGVIDAHAQSVGGHFCTYSNIISDDEHFKFCENPSDMKKTCFFSFSKNNNTDNLEYEPLSAEKYDVMKTNSGLSNNNETSKFEQDNSDTSNVYTQTEPDHHLNARLSQIIDNDLIDWSNGNQKARGEKLIETMRYQIQCLTIELHNLKEEKQLMELNQARKLAEVESDLKMDIERIKEQHKMEIAKINHTEILEIQGIYSKAAEKIKALEEDVSLAFDLMSKADGQEQNDIKAKNKFTMDENQKSGYDLATIKITNEKYFIKLNENSELKSKLTNLGNVIEEMEKVQTQNFQKAENCNYLKNNLDSLLSKMRNYNHQSDKSESFEDQMLNSISKLNQVLNKKSFIETLSLTEKTLLDFAVELLYHLKMSSLNVSRLNLEVMRLSNVKNDYQIDNFKEVNEFERVLKIEKDLQHCKNVNNRLTRINNFLKQKIDHIKEFQNELTIDHCNRKASSYEFSLPNTTSYNDKGTFVNNSPTEKDLTRESKTDLKMIISGDDSNSQILKILENSYFIDCQQNSFQDIFDIQVENLNKSGRFKQAVLDSEVTKRILVKLFWKLITTCFRLESELNFKKVELKEAKNSINNLIKIHESEKEDFKSQLIAQKEWFHEALEQDKTKYNKEIGTLKIYLEIYRKKLESSNKIWQTESDQNEKLIKECFQSDRTKFKTLTEHVSFMESDVASLKAKQKLWRGLCKALASQNVSPSSENEENIKVKWYQLVGTEIIETNSSDYHMITNQEKPKSSSLKQPSRSNKQSLSTRNLAQKIKGKPNFNSISNVKVGTEEDIRLNSFENKLDKVDTFSSCLKEIVEQSIGAWDSLSEDFDFKIQDQEASLILETKINKLYSFKVNQRIEKTSTKTSEFFEKAVNEAVCLMLSQMKVKDDKIKILESQQDDSFKQYQISNQRINELICELNKYKEMLNNTNCELEISRIDQEKSNSRQLEENSFLREHSKLLMKSYLECKESKRVIKTVIDFLIEQDASHEIGCPFILALKDINIEAEHENFDEDLIRDLENSTRLGLNFDMEKEHNNFRIDENIMGNKDLLRRLSIAVDQPKTQVAKSKQNNLFIEDYMGNNKTVSYQEKAPQNSGICEDSNQIMSHESKDFGETQEDYILCDQGSNCEKSLNDSPSTYLLRNKSSNKHQKYQSQTLNSLLTASSYAKPSDQLNTMTFDIHLENSSQLHDVKRGGVESIENRISFKDCNINPGTRLESNIN